MYNMQKIDIIKTECNMKYNTINSNRQHRKYNSLKSNYRSDPQYTDCAERPAHGVFSGLGTNILKRIV